MPLASLKLREGKKAKPEQFNPMPTNVAPDRSNRSRRQDPQVKTMSWVCVSLDPASAVEGTEALWPSRF